MGCPYHTLSYLLLLATLSKIYERATQTLVNINCRLPPELYACRARIQENIGCVAVYLCLVDERLTPLYPADADNDIPGFIGDAPPQMVERGVPILHDFRKTSN